VDGRRQFGQPDIDVLHKSIYALVTGTISDVRPAPPSSSERQRRGRRLKAFG
jgi:hypothetical protein